MHQDVRMLIPEEGLKLQKTEEVENEEEDQIKEQPPLSDQMFSRNSYVYANEDQDNDQYFQTGIYKKWAI